MSRFAIVDTLLHSLALDSASKLEAALIANPALINEPAHDGRSLLELAFQNYSYLEAEAGVEQATAKTIALKQIELLLIHGCPFPAVSFDSDTGQLSMEIEIDADMDIECINLEADAHSELLDILRQQCRRVKSGVAIYNAIAFDCYSNAIQLSKQCVEVYKQCPGLANEAEFPSDNATKALVDLRDDKGKTLLDIALEKFTLCREAKKEVEAKQLTQLCGWFSMVGVPTQFPDLYLNVRSYHFLLAERECLRQLIAAIKNTANPMAAVKLCQSQLLQLHIDFNKINPPEVEADLPHSYCCRLCDIKLDDGYSLLDLIVERLIKSKDPAERVELRRLAKDFEKIGVPYYKGKTLSRHHDATSFGLLTGGIVSERGKAARQKAIKASAHEAGGVGRPPRHSV